MSLSQPPGDPGSEKLLRLGRRQGEREEAQAAFERSARTLGWLVRRPRRGGRDLGRRRARSRWTLRPPGVLGTKAPDKRFRASTGSNSADDSGFSRELRPGLPIMRSGEGLNRPEEPPIRGKHLS
ncbi:MAG: hypothetical protein AVDCRST_MAG05-71 [uncultured Rubrobacteraceae bacterium]|uniref:Uncharacterized protein n=1 Tax=uncultured Rubrobacteraceae bacterium TaxID=349277 RepID=A0A6J4RCE6_9ACTN|nr:MAG: hypothetical protein AVDCRST_MAG05-71 [uncultured Rubrobacteraceae bacterium]